jgi:epoxyqueuosine reductase
VPFAKDLPNDSPYAPREVLAVKDARTLARVVRHDTGGVQRDVQGLAHEVREAAGAQAQRRRRVRQPREPGDVDVLTRALDDPEPLVREHAAWALARLTHTRRD